MEKTKNKKTQEFVSQRYQRPPKVHYKYMTGNEVFEYPEENLSYYLSKVFSFNTLISIFLVLYLAGQGKIAEFFT